jgi:hypothetical protein
VAAGERQTADKKDERRVAKESYEYRDFDLKKSLHSISHKQNKYNNNNNNNNTN